MAQRLTPKVYRGLNSVKKLKNSLFDNSAADTGVAAVKHRELSFGYRALFFVEIHADKAVAYFHRAALFGLTIAELCRASEFLFFEWTS